MSSSATELVARGRAELAAGDVATARAAFEEAVRLGETGEALSGLAEVTYRQLDFPAASALYGRAISAYQREGRLSDAARVARTLAYQYALHGDDVLMTGWVERARRFVAEPAAVVEEHDAEEHGAERLAVERRWVDLFDALAEGDLSSRERRLWALAESGHGDRALQCDAKALLGRQYVEDGRVAEGMALLEEALTAVAAGEVDEFVVMEGALCLMLGACEETQDVERADRWTDVGDRISRGRGLASLGPLCRGYWGGVLTVAGRWDEAEAALTDTVRKLERGYAYARDSALVRLADLRLRQGMYEAAEELLRGLEEHPEAGHAHAALLLANGELARAQERIERTLTSSSGVALGRQLALLVDIHLAGGDLDAASAVATRLEHLAADGTSLALLALSAQAAGRLCLARGDGDAPACLRRALTSFARARMPLELAMARLDLARAVERSAPEVAVAEATLAREALNLLPAPRQADAATAVLRRLGVRTPPGPRNESVLTSRERVVLDLVGHGLTNPEIAARLSLSRKTVEHHVSRVLAKLGLRNRAEAAAYAVREGPHS